MSEHSVPVPQCCDYAKVYMKAVFDLSEDDYDNVNAFKEVKPKWYIRGTRTPEECNMELWKRMSRVNYHVKYCPSCGVTLPDFELKDDIDFGEFASMDNGGEWCDKCDDRSMNCTCTHPIKMWKILEV